MKDQLRGNVKLLFQPAEETVGGAEPMVAAGALENPHVDRVYGLHVQPYLPVGTIETRTGTLNASTDTVELIIHGKASHAGKIPPLAQNRKPKVSPLEQLKEQLAAAVEAQEFEQAAKLRDQIREMEGQ
jgi:metal-dependent amidase/aminoacylase/carboxypeptidase family protein